MPEDDWMQAAGAAIDGLVEQTVKQYRITAEESRRTVVDVFGRDPEFRKAALHAGSPEKLRRTRAFKDAATRVKQQIYYSLRRYRPAESDPAALLKPLRALVPGAPAADREAAARAVLQGHRSMSERLESMDAFYEQLFAAVGKPETILDIGCGVQPLAFPFDAAGKSVQKYVALDQDPQVIAAVEAYSRVRADGRLVAIQSDLSRGWTEILRPCGLAKFDLALMLKLIPVIQRQSRPLIETLAAAPAARWLLTGSRVALAKRKNIESRERAALERFVEAAGRVKTHAFTVGEEFAWLVQ